MTVEWKKVVEKYRSLIMLIVFAIIITLIRPSFLEPSNLLNVLRQTSINAVIAVGMSFVILTGGIDISVGSILAFAGAVGAWLIGLNINIVLVVLMVLIVGLASGAVNGILVTKGRLQPFIVTLATMTLFRGATLVFTDGRPISFSQEGTGIAFKWLGAGSIGFIPVPIIVMIIVYVIAHFVLNNTVFGRYIYAIGGNDEASLLSGVNTNSVRMRAYIINGGLAALAAIIVTARLSSAQPNAGIGYELDAIAAVVLGGTSLTGGQGKVLGTIIGALIIGMLNNSLNLMDVSSYYQTILKGIVILIAVLLDKKQK